MKRPACPECKAPLGAEGHPCPACGHAAGGPTCPGCGRAEVMRAHTDPDGALCQALASTPVPDPRPFDQQCPPWLLEQIGRMAIQAGEQHARATAASGLIAGLAEAQARQEAPPKREPQGPPPPPEKRPAEEVLAMLEECSPDQLLEVREREIANKGRKTVLRRINELLGEPAP